jgi:hypothetical protein
VFIHYLHNNRFDRTEMSHYVNLFDMHQKYADVIDLKEALVYIEEIATPSITIKQADNRNVWYSKGSTTEDAMMEGLNDHCRLFSLGVR